MKYIQNVTVPLTGRARNFAAAARAAIIDTEGVYTSVAHFLSGENPWGFHNDLRFTMPPAQVRQGLRIVAAAEHTLENSSSHVVLSDEDYEAVLSAVFKPQRHKTEMPVPAELARALMPLLTAIENAKDSP